jgi:hypothetical protein
MQDAVLVVQRVAVRQLGLSRQHPGQVLGVHPLPPEIVRPTQVLAGYPLSPSTFWLEVHLPLAGWVGLERRL